MTRPEYPKHILPPFDGPDQADLEAVRKAFDRLYLTAITPAVRGLALATREQFSTLMHRLANDIRPLAEIDHSPDSPDNPLRPFMRAMDTLGDFHRDREHDIKRGALPKPGHGFLNVNEVPFWDDPL